MTYSGVGNPSPVRRETYGKQKVTGVMGKTPLTCERLPWQQEPGSGGEFEIPFLSTTVRWLRMTRQLVAEHKTEQIAKLPEGMEIIHDIPIKDMDVIQRINLALMYFAVGARAGFLPTAFPSELWSKKNDWLCSWLVQKTEVDGNVLFSPVGFCVHEAREPEREIRFIGLRRRYHGKGIGKAFLQNLIKHFAELDNGAPREVCLRSTEHTGRRDQSGNMVVPAYLFYISLGFQVWHERKIETAYNTPLYYREMGRKRNRDFLERRIAAELFHPAVLRGEHRLNLEVRRSDVRNMQGPSA